ncbi:hypothetical protein FLA105534_04844 [Flavobacterium bizetiae]|uniref:SGNH/GDSL hydrolase family protein n=1 Tax=Flavobacterium bizetiae TaxID=2704140 RepID=A0A6J4GWG6_9FLAO|nr:hypothetical protein [Flavobacterium bizetiae]CAA9203664.1 hypothetical protein FLA105534_04844 [Flavobacterium bizetiae]CAD5344534.1 hypothetical protein FLA105535_04540 [Flavobacterium bizetiae]CAD5350603.1 hypothetical protein FLA105534_04594 [Flavobacterium bizetiae]
MKKFLVYMVKILIIIILIAGVLDVAFTYVFMQSKNRGKIETVFNSKSEKYDVIILGSSRANNHFVSQIFEDEGLKSFNYGMSGGHLFEAALMLKLMVERKYVIKNVILEADLNLSSDYNAEGISALFLPYIHNSDVIKKHFESQENFNELYYIPLYRYIKYDTKIGFREVFFTAIHKKTNALDNLGYYPLEKHKNGNMKNNIINLNPLPHNKYYEEIKAICKAHNINLITVMTPMCENVIGIDYFDKVKAAYPEIYNYENVVKENKYFSSCGHMTDEGAKIFTARILKDFFNK